MTALTSRSQAFRMALGRRPPGRETLVVYQDRALRRLVRHAYARVPYYRQLLDQVGIGPDDVNTLRDLGVLPLTSKRDRLAVPAEQFVASGLDPRRLVVHTTTGSTGEPTVVWRTPLEEHLLGAFRLRALRWLGFRFTDRTARIGLVRPGGGFASPLLPALRRLGLFQLDEIDTRLPVDEVARRLTRFQPNVITGFAAAVARATSHLGDGAHRLVRPRLVVVGGETLTPLMRHQITTALRAPVREWYGSHECNLLAWECGQTGLLHVCDDNVLVEVIRDGREVLPGEQGEVVVTGLHSLAMPFIRYRLGDVATKGPTPCPCGAPFSTLAGIQGRVHDLLVLSDGRRIHPYEIILELHGEFRWVGQYQLEQTRPGEITLRLLPRVAPPADTIARLVGRVEARLGGRARLRVELVTAIDREPTGKFRVARSLLGSAYHTHPGIGP